MTKSLCWVKRLHSTTERKCAQDQSLHWEDPHSTEALEIVTIFSREGLRHLRLNLLISMNL